MLWTYDANQTYTTVNGMQAKGGSFNGPGPVIAGGMVFMNAGYAYLGFGTGGNVLPLRINLRDGNLPRPLPRRRADVPLHDWRPQPDHRGP